ncbi:MAG: protein kinase [Planctomycetota bacterium]
MPQAVCPQCQQLVDELTDGLCQSCFTGDLAQETIPPTNPRTADDASSEPTLLPQSGNRHQDDDATHPTDLKTVLPGSSVPDSDHKSNDTLGDYELLEEIGRGGMGVIYKARHRKLNRVAAIKVIIGGRFTSEADLQRFYIEAEAAARLDHPNIVPFYEIGEHAGQPFFAMKYLEGGSLADHIGQFKDDQHAAATTVAKVARAVNHAHQMGVLHRDLKPANILLDNDGEPLLTDLGLAKDTVGNSSLTQSGAVMGTPNYMAPEQAAGKPVTIAADIYGLGAILYEMLAGQTTYQGASPVDVLMKVIEGPPVPPQQVNSNVDRDLSLICMKCLDPEPEKRYASALELAKDLEAWLAGRSISVRPPSLASLAARWYKHNRQLVYFSFAILAGIVIVLPLIALFVAGETATANRGETSSVTEVAIVGLVGTLVLLWPSLGFLNALIANPTSGWGAVRAGLVTSALLSLTFYMLLGWMVFVQGARNDSGKKIQALSSAVWPPDDMSREEAVDVIEKAIPGLTEIEDSKRSEFVLREIQYGQVTSAMFSLALIIMVCFLMSVPIVYGSFVGYVLLQRDTWKIVAFIRYTLTWWLMSLIFAITILWFTGSAELGGLRTDENYWLYFVLAGVLGSLIYLVLKRWGTSKTTTRASKDNSTEKLIEKNRLSTEP